MRFDDLRDNWETFGRTNPLWAIHTGEGEIEWDEQEFFASGEQQVTRILELLKSLEADPPRDRALDFGCGVGRLTFALAEEFDRVDGVDISTAMIDAANLYRTKFDGEEFGETAFHLNTNLDLSLFESQQFSFVLSLVVLQHMKPEFSKTYIAEFCRVLAPGGILAFQIPARRETAMLRIRGFIGRSARKVRYALRSGESPLMEMYGTPRKEVERLISASGLRLIDVVADEFAATWESYTYVATRD